MSNIALVLKTAEGNTIARYDLNTARVAQIDAVNGAYYQFTDAATGTGPVRIDTARSGDDLLISFDNSNGTDLIIKDYFARGEGALVGMQNNGELYRYPVIVTPEHVLAEHIETAPAYASGAEGAVAAGSSGGSSTLGVLGTIGAVGLVAGGIAIAAHNHDKHHKNDHHDNPPNPQPPTPQNPSNPGNTPTPPNQNPGNNTNPLFPPGPNNPNNPNPNNPNPQPNPTIQSWVECWYTT